MGEFLEWHRCARLNETVCEFVTDHAALEGSSVRIAVATQERLYDPTLGQNISTYLRMAVCENSEFITVMAGE